MMATLVQQLTDIIKSDALTAEQKLKAAFEAVHADVVNALNSTDLKGALETLVNAVSAHVSTLEQMIAAKAPSENVNPPTPPAG